MHLQVHTKIIYVVAFVIAIGTLTYLYYVYNPATNSFFIPCPFKHLTGLECPGCGSQRATHQLLHGNFVNAFWINPLLIISLPLILYSLFLKACNFLFNKQKRVGIFYSKKFIYIYFGCVILFWVLRNIPISPFTHLSSNT